MQNQAYFLFRLGNKRQMPYFFSVFTRRKHTFSIQETYISPSRDIRFPAGKHKKCQEPFPSTPQRFLIHLSLFFLSASRQTTTHKLPEKAFEIQRIFPIFVVFLNNLSDYQLFIRNSHENGQRIRKCRTVRKRHISHAFK